MGVYIYVYRNHVYDKGEGGPKSIELKEIGPRFELRLYQVLYSRFILFCVYLITDLKLSFSFGFDKI